MNRKSVTTGQALRAENAELRARLAEAEEMLRAIRAGEVDALVVESAAGPQLFTLQGLDAEQNRFRGDMLAQVSDAVIATDLDERVTFLNAAAERQYRVRASDVLGRSFAEIYTRQWPNPEAEAGMWTALREHGEWRGELIQRTHDGRELHVEKVITTLRDPDGAPTGHVAAIRDITERKRMDQRLREEEHRLRLAMAAAATGMWDWDVATNQVVWTPECYVIHGVREGEFDGTAAAFDRLLHLDDRGRVWAAVTTAVERGTLYEAEFRIVRPTGEVRWVSNKGRAISDGAGVSQRMVGTITDITARKQAEAALRLTNERFDLAVKCSQVVLFQQDLELRYTWIQNPVPGFDGPDVIGKRDVDLMERAEDAAVTEGLKREVIRAGVGVRQEVLLQIQGVERHYDLSVEPLRDAAGRISGVTCAGIDITARKQAEETLREKSHFLQRISEVTPGVLHVFDLAERRSVFINRTVASLLGFSPEEVAAMGADVAPILMHPDDLPRFAQHLARIATLADGEVADFEHRMRDRAGGWHWFHSHDAVFARDAAGGARQLIGVATDITERKGVEEAMTRLAAIVESSHDALFGEDLGGIITSWNAGAEQIFGYREEEMIGTSIMRLIPDGRQAEEHEIQRKLAAGERGGTFETIRRTKDGREFPASITVSPLKDASGHIIGTSRAVRDITERKEAEAALHANEERMRLATAATEVGIWEWNVLTGFIRWDAQMFRLYGVAPTADGFVSYDTWSRAVMPEDLPRQEEVLMDTVRRIGQSNREFRILRADDGESRWIQAVETVRANHEGQAEWVVGTNLDVTAQKNAERTIREEGKRKDEFLAMLGHELRNPLNAIRHAVQISGETPDDAEACQWAARVIDRQSQQVSRMVDDLLDVARINQGRIELRVESLDLGTVLEGAVSVVRVNAEQRRHALAVEIGDGLRVTGDAARLEQVFVNLLNNAIKYTPEAGSISVRARNEDGEVIVTITDNGVGIPAELLPHVFDLFRQAESTLARAQGGLGIGLSVVKSLVEMHLGRVTVESAGANTGTTVTVRLPLLLEMRHTLAPPATPAPRDTSERRIRVLVVDDHEDAAQALARLLTRRGCEVRLAHTGPDGVAVARDFLPEVLLLDLGLPGFDGYELARILRAEAPFSEAIFVAITGYAQDADHARCLAAGFDDHFAKPLDFSKLMEAIHARRVEAPR